ncbi:MAG TPA: fluoride efflux transporter CrcB [Bacteroidales bacterium]|nr:fluoride efflux transporter CrcB [Bacteroidales bacterium]HPI86407.1 fluoride efflux transporter CrcB [Bacteroidales bacterium]
MLKMFLITGAGGFIGSGLRYLVQRVIAIYLPVTFPFATLFINVFGSLLIGIIYALSDKTSMLNPEMRIFLAIGVCGGFTTFSTFSLDTYSLVKDGAYLFVSLYIFASVILSIAAVFAGIWIVKSL